MLKSDISEPIMRPIRPLGPVPDAPSGLVLKPKACVQCRTRKVKCDRETPCGNCIRWSLDCVFPSPIRKCRRPRKATAGSSPRAVRTPPAGVRRSPPPDVMQRLEETLQGLARFMGEHEARAAGEHNSDGVPASRRDSPASGSGWEDLQDKLAVVTELVSRLSSNGSFAPPTPPPQSLLSGISSSFATLNYPSPQPFPIDTFNLDVSPFHPGSTQIRISWQAFLIHIDPLVKVLHRSTTERILFKAARDPTSLTNSETAIVFTIYFSSLSALSEDDAQRCFGIPKQAAQSTFKSAAEHALAKTNLLAQTHVDADLTSLQAFVLFLSLGRFTDHAPRVWALTGLVRRLDSISAWKSSSPFEEEIRRRLRWELWCLDHRAHEDSGRGPAPPDTGGAPDLPLNVSDVNLDASLPATPLPDLGWTEISFSLVRFEIARTARTIEFLPTTSQKLAMVDECERTVQSRYLTYCDGSEPVHWLAQHVAHVLLMELRFKLLRQDQYSSPYSNPGACSEIDSRPTQDRLFLQAIDIVDTERRVEAEPQAKQWSWLLVGYMQFWPLSFLLSELRHRHSSEEAEHGWDVAERALARRKEDDTSENMETLRRLMEEARLERSHRTSGSQRVTASTGANQPLGGSPCSCSMGTGTQNFLNSFMENGMHEMPGSSTGDSLGYMGLNNPLLPQACNGLGWGWTQHSTDGASGTFNFAFDDGDTFLELEEVAPAPPMPCAL